MNGMFKEMIGLLSVCFLQVASATTVEEARAQALSSTNFWGVSFAEYRSRIGESVPFLATNGTLRLVCVSCRTFFSDQFSCLLWGLVG